MRGVCLLSCSFEVIASLLLLPYSQRHHLPEQMGLLCSAEPHPENNSSRAQCPVAAGIKTNLRCTSMLLQGPPALCKPSPESETGISSVSSQQSSNLLINAEVSWCTSAFVLLMAAALLCVQRGSAQMHC